ncbi:mitotic spindle checkpoint component mad2 [Cokeromyces recurvatus]|uniref:mitotic spindle checkpoint component mad2 n=1 Tax=Cokeromyces recurvatus TaxID=90255 RepID=UPI00222090E1|nr:mitotic spindle checkpoint component mad2 [Cokeromyces recurvatus]KAI7904484.1 mitotic spindle checkpoint component mad2 [Cokeromyces recurvatus]
MESHSSFTLEGSSSLIVDFFECSLSNILYQRGIYPFEDFKMIKKYGVNIVTSDNPELTDYIRQIVKQLRVWLKENKLSKFVIVIKSKDTNEVLERWNFNLDVNGENGLPMTENIPPEQVDLIQETAVKQIRSILRQITSSVSFLPELEGDNCTFNVLVYTDNDVEVPQTWADSGPNLIKGGGEHVRLRSVRTLGHKVDSFVAYKKEEDF